MAREVRIQYPGAFYHIVARGNTGAPVYQDDADKKWFLETLGDTCAKTGWMIHSYVLMRDHYHFLVETPEPNLAVGMKWLQGTYTRRHNLRHRRFGHLFQGRYRAVPIEASHYFSVVSAYIHLNPVRAGLLRLGEQPLTSYPWSSYPFYFKGPEDRPAWMQVERILGELGCLAADDHSRQSYTTYMECCASEWGTPKGRQRLEKQWHMIRHGWYIGSKDFRNQLLVEVGRIRHLHQPASYFGGAKSAHDEQAAEALLELGLRRLGFSVSQIQMKAKGAPEKQVLAWWLRRRTTMSRQWISDRLRMGDESRVTKSVCAVGAAESGELQRLKGMLLENEDRNDGGLMLPVPDFLD